VNPENLKWYTSIEEQIDNENGYSLGHWKETDINYEAGCHMMFPPPTLEIAAAPMEVEEIAAAPRTERVATTTSSAPPPQTNQLNGASRALSGVPPPIFNGDRDKSELFLDKFTSYKIVNGDVKQFTTPYLKVALCLSYFNGPKVDAWARHKRQWLKERHLNDGVPMTDPSLWTDFETDF